MIITIIVLENLLSVLMEHKEKDQHWVNLEKNFIISRESE